MKLEMTKEKFFDAALRCDRTTGEGFCANCVLCGICDGKSLVAIVDEAREENT